MSLLCEIQKDILVPEKGLGPILLKLRLLADRLGSEQLEEWVKFESEGYPREVDVPEYRIIELSYTGNFHNTAWQMNNQPIPPYLIKKYCGESWTSYKVRESISSIEGMRKKFEAGQQFGVDASNLILMLEGKICPGMHCSSIDA